MKGLGCIYLVIVCTINVVISGVIVKETRLQGGYSVELNSTSKWPWLVAFMSRENDEFFCSGTLIGKQHVLSAAHCFHPKNSETTIKADSFYILLGQLDLGNVENMESRYVVEEIFVHPDWKPYEKSYDADIAIVKLVKSVKFNENITTLPYRSNKEFVRGGFVVGWGFSESSSSVNESSQVEVARELPIRAVMNEDCFLEFSNSAIISSRRTYCGGWPGFDANVCRGDSGGGFYIRSNDEWSIQGIVSASYLVPGLKCNVEQYAVFTKVSSFLSWINMIIKHSEVLYLNPVSMNCKLEQSDRLCRVENFEIYGNSDEVVSSDSYTRNSPNIKSTEIVMKNQSVFMIPFGLKRLFPNLISLTVAESELKSVNRKSVAGLKILALFDNQIAEIPIDTFWDCPDLVILNLNKNDIKTLDENLFIRSPNLQRFAANYNKIEHLHKDLFRDTQKLEQVSFAGNKLKVIDVDFIKIRSLLKIYLRRNICVNSTYIIDPNNQISKFKLHVEIATNC